MLGRSWGDCTSHGGWGTLHPEIGINHEKAKKSLKYRIPFAERHVIDITTLADGCGTGPWLLLGRYRSGANMLRALKKQTRKRSVHPQGDTLYRAAAVAAALMMLAAAPFF
jgi:hypothetical protein